MSYDSDESGKLEPNELTNLYDQMQTVAVLNGMDPNVAVVQVDKMKKLLDPSNLGTVSQSVFFKVGTECPDLLNILIPDPLLPSANWVNVFSLINISSELNDATLGLFQLCQNYESQDVTSVLNILNAP